MRHSVWILMCVLAGCGQLGPEAFGDAGSGGQDAAQVADADASELPPAPPSAARTVDEFDTTTAAQRAEATASVPINVAAQRLGMTIASLGDPTEPGFWMETPLVSEQGAGRVVYAGESVNVTLRPIDGPATAGSRLSLPAMRLLGAPLTALPEVEVFRD